MSDDFSPDPTPKDWEGAGKDNQASSQSGSIVPVDRPVQDRSNTRYDAPNPQRLDALAQEVLELKLVSLSETEDFGHEIHRLRHQINWLIGLFVVVVAVMGGTLTWLAFNLRAEQSRMAQDLSSVVATSADVDRLATLERQVDDLVDQLPADLASQFTALETQVQAQMGELEDEVSTLSSSVNTRRQTISILARALQDLIEAEESGISPEVETLAPVPEAEATPDPETAEEEAAEEDEAE